MSNPQEHKLAVHGMHCANCALSVEKVLTDKFQTTNTSVNFATNRASFLLDSSQSLDKVKEAIRSLGYQVSEISDISDSSAERQLQRYLLICSVLTLPLFLHMFLPDGVLGKAWLQLILCTPVYIIALKYFGLSAYRSLKNGLPNMDLLVIIGVSAAFGYSCYGALFGLGHKYLFFETASTITTLVLLGNFIEQHSIRKTSSAISELASYQPQTARRLTDALSGSSVEIIAVEQLQPGDLIALHSGDRIPSDARLLTGQLDVDESMLTGESLPVSKEEEDKLIGGTLVVNGNATAEVTLLGEETILARLIRLVESAQTQKPEIQRLGDLVSAYFIPVVLSIALITFLFSFVWFNLGLEESMLRAIAVLVIACPCAMGLATPTAIMVAVGRAAREGILIKGGDTLERLAKAQTCVFDKTGTLTTGKFTVLEAKILGDQTESVVLQILRGLERHSSHPIAQSLSDYYQDIRPAELLDVQEHKGLGMSGKDQNGILWELQSNHDKSISGDLLLLRQGQLVASFLIADQMREHARQTVSQIRKLHLHPVILSGDSHPKVDALARQLDISDYKARLLPSDKLTELERLNKQASIIFVGDGINDAPALARADVGVSLSEASDIAIESAQILLVGNDLRLLPQAIKLSRATLRTIKQNLFWAFFYNVLAIPVAAAGLLSPTLAAFTMAFSDVFVIGNSLRLRSRKID